MVVSAKHTPSALGRFVRCIRLLADGEAVGRHQWFRSTPGPVWLVEAQGGPLLWVGDAVMRRAFSDACLRPIRDPGDDARDETLDWLPVQAKELA